MRTVIALSFLLASCALKSKAPAEITILADSGSFTSSNMLLSGVWGLFSIGYAFKDEAVSDEFTFRPTPLIDQGLAGAWDEGQIETPEVIRKSSKVHILYSSMPKNQFAPETKSARYQIGVATLDLADHASANLEDILLNQPQLRFQRNSGYKYPDPKEMQTVYQTMSKGLSNDWL